ncbi:actin interacting protein 3 Bud6 [Schizosaccharomyces octosporus yFS286]|uniref:Actin interacting protein 3 Bud6 n=1 Tax=Schizosaccharomyces octosporus (strain yFS286) TaxID=483514 RepID=S9Q196_SCHOY|nr:actin interacting protein 3 Bud6 [Schizosaccharomyces octosporus yFS286]EPX73932.1 actin interacting protein 3 Bud6 [Schizosaccharomyces octosporus yFS286]
MSFHNNDQEFLGSNNPGIPRQRTDSMNSSSLRYPSVSNSQRAPSVMSGRKYSGDKFTPIANSIESSVTKLLVITKQLLESLTKWSKRLAEPDDISTIYIRLVTEFNTTIRIFREVGIESLDLEDFPLELRSILEETLAEIPSMESLQRHLPHVREIMMHLLKSLKYKQSLYKSRYLKPRKESLASRGSEDNTSRKGSSEYAFSNRSTNFENLLGSTATPDTPNALNALKQSSTLERRASKRLSKMNKIAQQGLDDDTSKSGITVESVRDLLTDSQAADNKPLSTSVKNPSESPRLDKFSSLTEEKPAMDDFINEPSPKSGFPKLSYSKPEGPSFFPRYAYELNNPNTAHFSDKDQNYMPTSFKTRSFSSGKTTSPEYVPSSTPVLLPRGRSFTTPIPDEAPLVLESGSQNPQQIEKPQQVIYTHKENEKKEEETHDWDPQDFQKNKDTQANNIDPASLSQQNEEIQNHLNEEDQIKPPLADLNANETSNETSRMPKHDSLEELDRLVNTNNSLSTDVGISKMPINEEEDEREYTSADKRLLPSGDMDVVRDHSETTKEERQPMENSEYTGENNEALHKQEKPNEFENNNGNFVYFLRFNDKTYKVTSPLVVDTQKKLRDLFQSKFGNEFLDLSFEFYVEDQDTKVNYLLEDYSDVKPKSLVIAQKQQQDSKEKLSIDNKKAMVERDTSHEETPVEEMKSSPLFQELLQRLINIETKVSNGHTTNAPFQPSSSFKNPKRGKIETDTTTYQQVKSLQLELASLKQVFATSFAKIPLQLNNFRNQMNIINQKASGFGFDRGYILRSKDSIEVAAKSLVKRFDDINDQIELLRSDVLLRKVRPGLDQTSYLNKEKESIENGIRELQKSIEEVTPTWKKQWEKELNAIVQEQEFLDNHTSLVADLNKDFDSVTTVLSNVSAIAELQARSGIKSKPLSVKPTSTDIKGIREQIHTDVLKLRPDSDVRLQAIERFEAFQRKKVLLHVDEFEQEIQEFINDDKLRKIGGVEEIERRRLVQDEQTRKLLWKGGSNNADLNNTDKSSISTENEQRESTVQPSSTNAHSIPNLTRVDRPLDGISNESQDTGESSIVPLPIERGENGEKETDTSLINASHSVSSDSLDTMKNNTVSPANTYNRADLDEEKEADSFRNMTRNASSDSLDAMENDITSSSIIHDTSDHDEEKENSSILRDMVPSVSSKSEEDMHSGKPMAAPQSTDLSKLENAEENIGFTEKGLDSSQLYDANDKTSSEVPDTLLDNGGANLPSTGPTVTEESEANEKGTVPNVKHHRRNDTISTDDYEAYQDAEDDDNSLT